MHLIVKKNFIGTHFTKIYNMLKASDEYKKFPDCTFC